MFRFIVLVTTTVSIWKYGKLPFPSPSSCHSSSSYNFLIVYAFLFDSMISLYFCMQLILWGFSSSSEHESNKALTHCHLSFFFCYNGLMVVFLVEQFLEKDPQVWITTTVTLWYNNLKGKEYKCIANLLVFFYHDCELMVHRTFMRCTCSLL